MFGFFKKREPKIQLDSSMIVPRIKNIKFLESLRSVGIPPDQMPIVEPLVADLLVTYAFELSDTFVMTTPLHLSKIGIEATSLCDLAIENLKRKCPRISLQQSGSIFRAVTGNNLEACTLLSRKIWENYSQQFKGDLLASVPNRDLVLFCDSESENGLHEMKEIAQQAYEAGGNHALTLALLRWSNIGWQVYEV